MRPQRLHRRVVDERVGRAAEFPVRHDGMLLGGRVIVWRILPLRVADGQAPRASAPGAGRPPADVAVRRLWDGGLFPAEDSAGHPARVSDHRPRGAVLHPLRRVGGEPRAARGGRFAPAELHVAGFRPARGVSDAGGVGVQRIDFHAQLKIEPAGSSDADAADG